MILPWKNNVVNNVELALKSINAELSSVFRGDFYAEFKKSKVVGGMNEKFMSEYGTTDLIYPENQQYFTHDEMEWTQGLCNKEELTIEDFNQLLSYRLWINKKGVILQVRLMGDVEIAFLIRELKTGAIHPENYYSKWLRIFKSELDNRLHNIELVVDHQENENE